MIMLFLIILNNNVTIAMTVQLVWQMFVSVWMLAFILFIDLSPPSLSLSLLSLPPSLSLLKATNYAEVEHSANTSSSKRQAPPKPAKSTSQEPVVYSAIQKLEASHNSPPQEGTEYADLDHSASASGRYNQRPKDTSNQVQYSHVSHDRRWGRGGNHGNYY